VKKNALQLIEIVSASGMGSKGEKIGYILVEFGTYAQR